ncbi:Endo-1,4-beta-xylanase A precursor [Croceitalea dokdonensis DOKDO 023]|uniref:Endo-1,4-beta-xylanase A n=1 Tax=Croceitalea dokdonensis DOKDO 023 TaxID=1300341 RepID=A0A0P7AS74_9FLAO|nr:glycoside hydrolase family 5 protein [Croceitalea dokdonensis]KPM30791.1 Endo-1,4-beta-xylanase A precursor [Croceitalea dokdonensis DOKDO 023]
MKYGMPIIFLALFLLSCSSDEVQVSVVPRDEISEEPTDDTNAGSNDNQGSNNGSASDVDNGVMRGLSPTEIVADMKTGWNLGNSLDVEGPDETLWGNPATTQAMIDEVANRGFKTLRVPVTWRFHQGPAPDYIVESEWLDRVEEVVNYGRANNMYIILNVHHDDPWIIPTTSQADAVKDRLSKLWTQIANRFKNYSDYVIFETLNESRHENTPQEWTGGTAEGRDVVNQYHQVSLDAIRATGGNNSTRKIMISTYAASTLPVAMDALVIPNNDENTMVSLHSYFPFPFTLGGTDTTWGSDDDKAQLEAEMDRIKTEFTDNGIAVVLGEWSSGNQNNIEDRLEHAAFYAEKAAERGFASVWWDNGNSGVSNDGLAIFDRRSLSWPFGSIADIIIDANE